MPCDLLLDWNLLWHGLSNGVSNARKYGDKRRVRIELQYADGQLVLQVVNRVDREAQARLIASHGSDSTHLLHTRGEGSTAMSTNVGSQALLACARLLDGSVALRFSLDETRLVLKVAAQRPASMALSESLVVWFLDDDPTTRRRYRAAWLKPPLDPASRVLPELGLSPKATDAAMRTFVADVLAASPRPGALLLDQNLQSQVLPTENVTTGTEITRELRKAGFDGTIVIRSANVSRHITEEYKAAGADAVVSKDQERDALLDALHAATNRTTRGEVDGDYDYTTIPLLDLGDVVWSQIEFSERVEMVADFRDGAQMIVKHVSSALAAGELGPLPVLLHSLAGKSRDIGAPRIQAYAARCKESFLPAHLNDLISLLEHTLGSMERALEQDVDTDVPDQTCGQALSLVPLAELSLTGAARDQVVESFRASSLRYLDALRVQLESSRPCAQLLHSLIGSAGSVNATRLVKWLLTFQGQAMAFGPAELKELTALLTDTQEALGAPGADFMLATTPAPMPAAVPQVAALTITGLFVAGIDDSLMSKTVQERVLFPMLGADMAISCCVGVTKEEQLGFLEFALGHVDKNLQPLQQPFRQADIVTVDQHIDMDGKPHVIGTDLVARLREAGFTGVACIISGGSPVEVARLEAMRGVDVATSKSNAMGEDFVARVLEALTRRQAEEAGRLGGKGGDASGGNSKDHKGGSPPSGGDPGSSSSTGNTSSRASSEGARDGNTSNTRCSSGAGRADENRGGSGGGGNISGGTSSSKRKEESGGTIESFAAKSFPVTARLPSPHSLFLHAIGWPAFVKDTEKEAIRAAVSLPVAPIPPKLFVDLANMRNQSIAVARELLVPLYDEYDQRALRTTLQQLQDAFLDGGGNRDDLLRLVHRFIGDASAGCAPALVWLAQQFRVAPSMHGITALSHALAATRVQLQAISVLPPAQEDEDADAAGFTDLREWWPSADLDVHTSMVENAELGARERSSLTCVGLDSHWSGRSMQAMFFEHGLGADPSRCCVVDDGVRDTEAVIQVVLGRLDAQFQPVPLHKQRHADVVLLNQVQAIRLFMPDGGGPPDIEVLGNGIAAQLQQQGYRGTVCILTSLAREGIAHLRTLPGIDVVQSKGALHANMAAQVLEVVEIKQRQARNELGIFMHRVRGVTNAVAELQQQGGGTDTSEVLCTLNDLMSTAAHVDIPAVSAACDAMLSTLQSSGDRDSSHGQKVIALAAVSVSAHAAVETAVGTVDSTELPADLALIQLAQLVTETIRLDALQNEDTLLAEQLTWSDDPVELAIDEAHARVGVASHLCPPLLTLLPTGMCATRQH